jgi:hypothetical protein
VIALRVFPGAKVRGYPTDGAKAFAALQLVDAFARSHAVDAHTVQYAAGADEHGRHRLTVASLPRGVVPVMVVQLVDVDCVDAHKVGGEAGPEWRAAEQGKIARLRADHPGVVAYDTRGGYRLVALLREPVAITDAHAAARWRALVARRLAWLAREYGIEGDAACVDWTRLFRLPHATRAKRDGTRGDAPERRPVHGAWADLGAWPDLTDDTRDADLATLRERGWDALAGHVAPATPKGPAAPRAPRSRAVRPPKVIADLGAVSQVIRGTAAALGAIPRGHGDRHHALLAVVGALVDAGWPEAALRRAAADLGAILGDAGDELSSAVTQTLRRAAEGSPYYARAYLFDHHVAVADALKPALEAPGDRARRMLDRVPLPRECSADEASRRVADLLDRVRADRTVAVVAVTAGAGKSHAACEAARDAARRGHRTALVVVSHAVARENADRLRGWGVRVAYLGGVLSHRDETGAPVCHHADHAAALASAGVGTVDTLCDGRGYAHRRDTRDEQGAGRRRLPIVDENPRDGADAPCSHRDTCAAYAARREQLVALETADVMVTVHALAETAHRWLADRPDGALVVVDEAPELLVAARVTADELRAAAAQVTARRSAVSRSEGWRGELLFALAAGLAVVDEGATTRDALLAGLTQAAELVADSDEQREARVAAWAQRSGLTRSLRPRRQHAPRPARRVVDTARSRGALPAGVVDALRVTGLVGRALAAEYGHAHRTLATVGTREHGAEAGARELRITATAAPLAELLADGRIGRVVLDATADARTLGAVLGCDVAVHHLAVADGAQVTRVFVPWSHASRRACLPDGAEGAVVWSELRGPMREGLRLAAEQVPRGGRLLAVTWLPVVRAIRGGLADPAVMADLADLAARGVTVEWTHYGAVRGVDRWRDVDAVLAVGTPWPDAGAIAQVCAAAGLDGADRDVGVNMARGELEQVCGRLRAPRRTRTARVVVVASVPPLRADGRWQVRELPTGRPRRDDADALATAEGVTVNAAAAAAGVSRSTIQRRRREARSAREGEGAGEGGVSQPVEGVPATPFDTPPSQGVTPSPSSPFAPFRPLPPCSRGGALTRACPAPGRMPDRTPPDTPVDRLYDSALRYGS